MAVLTSLPSTRSSVSLDFQVQLTKDALSKAMASGEFHEMQAVLAAAKRLASEHDLGGAAATMLSEEATLVRDAILQQGDEATTRLQLHDSKAIDAITLRYWALMLEESKLRNQAGMPTSSMPGWQASSAADSGRPPLAEGAVSPDGYISVHSRINKMVWTPKKGDSFIFDDAVDDANHDWDGDIDRCGPRHCRPIDFTG